jgi:hypothetical protein
MEVVLSFRIVFTAHPVDFAGETSQVNYGKPFNRIMDRTARKSCRSMFDARQVPLLPVR